MSQFNVSVRIDAVDGVTPTLSKINTGLGTFKQAVQGVRTSTGQLIGTDFTGAMNNFNRPLTVATEKVTGFRDRLSQMGGILSTQATSFGVATASVWGIYNAYDSLTKVQIRASAAALRVQTLTTTLHSLTERLRIAREKGNLTDEQMAVLQERITDTTGKLNVAQERSADIAQDVQEAWAGFVTTVGPQVVSATASLVQLGSVMKSSFKDTGGFINTLKSTFSGLLPSFKSVGSSSLLLGQNIGNLVPKADQATGALSKMKNALGGIGVGGALLGGGILALGGFLVALGIDIVNTSKKIAELQLELKHLEVGSTAAFENMKAQSDAFFNSMGGQIDSFLTTTGTTKAIPFGNLIENVMGAANLEKDAATFKAEFSKTLDGIMSSATTTLAGELSPDVKSNIEKGVARLREYLIDTSKKNFASPAAFMNTVDVMKPIAAEIQRQSEELANLVAGGKVDVTGLMTKQTAEVNKFAEAIVKDLGGATKAASYPAAILSSTIDTLVQTMVDGGAAPPELANAIKTAANDIIKSGDDVSKNLATITKTVGITGVGIRHMGDEIAFTTDKTNPFNAGLALATKTIDDGAAALLQYNNTLKSSATFTELFGDKEKLVKEGRAEFAETNKLFLHGIELTNEEFNRTIDAENGNIKALDELAHSTTQTTDAMNDQLVTLLNTNAEATDYTRALTDLNMNQRLIAQGFEAGTKQAQEFFDSLVKGTQQEQVFIAALATGATQLGITSSLLSFSDSKMQELIKTTYEQSKGFRTLSLESAKSTTFLKDQVIISAQVAAGQKEGVTTANDWAVSMIKDTAAAKSHHTQLVALATEMTNLTGISGLSDDQLQQLMITFTETKDAAGALATVLHANVEASLSRLQNIISADKWKDFKTAFKDLDFGDAPKKFVNWAKDFDSGLRNIAKSGPPMQNVLDQLVAAANNGVLPIGKFKSGIGFLSDEMQKIDKKSGLDLSPVIAFLDRLKAGDPQDIIKHADSIQMMVDAIMSGDMSKATWDKIIDKIGESSATAAPKIDKLTGSLGSLSAQMAEGKPGPLSNLQLGQEVSKDFEKSLQPKDKKGEDMDAQIKKIKELQTAQASLVKTTAQMSASMVSSIGEAGKFIVGAFDEVRKGGIKSVGTMATTNVKTVSQMGASMVTSVGKAGSFVVGAFDEMKQDSLKSVGQLSSSAVKVTAQMAASMVASIGAMGKFVVGAFKEIASGVATSMSKIVNSMKTGESAAKSLQKSIDGLKSKDITVTTHYKTTGSPSGGGASGGISHAEGGLFYATQATGATYGEAGPEIAAFFPLRNVGQPRKGEYDITIPTPVLDTDGIRNALSGLGGPVVNRNSGSRSGPTTVYISIPVYLAEGLAPLKTFVRKVVLDDLGMFPST